MDTNVQALKNLYVALGGTLSNVENCNTSVEVLNAISALYDGASDAILNPDAINNIALVMATQMSTYSLEEEELVNLVERDITSFTIPSGVTVIGQSAFNGCANLESIVIPSNITSIGQYAFSGCTSLESVDIAASVTSIGAYAFSANTSLKSLTVRATTPPTLLVSSLSNVPADCAIYVPADSVDAYKAADNWSTRATYIEAIED